MKKYMMGFDIGTEGSKGILLDASGNVAAYHYVGHDVDRPHPGWAEHDAEKVWWGDFVKVSKGLLEKSGIDPHQIAGIGCSAMLPCMLPVDKDGVPLRKGMLYGLDTRTSAEIQQFVDDFGEEKLYSLSKVKMGAQFPGPKVVWFRKNEPELFKKAYKYHSATSYITFKLTGEHVMSYDLGSQYVPFFNFENRSWEKEMCEYCGITEDQLPRLDDAYAVAGTVTEAAHRETGLAAGTPVAVGTGDCIAEIMSMCAKEGDTALLYGSTFVFIALTDNMISNPLLFQDHYPIKSKYAVAGGTTTAASLTKWFKNNFGGEELAAEAAGGENAYDALSRQAEGIAPGSDGLIILPYFSGERTPVWDENARGVMFGLTLEHTKAHIYRAILEGTAFSVLHNLNELRAAGIRVDRIYAAGGGTKDKLWPQIVSDVTGVEQICLSNILGSPAGDALLGGIASGLVKDDEFLRENVEKSARKYIPNLENTKKYKEMFEIYRDVYNNTSDLMHRLGKIAAPAQAVDD